MTEFRPGDILMVSLTKIKFSWSQFIFCKTCQPIFFCPEGQMSEIWIQRPSTGGSIHLTRFDSGPSLCHFSPFSWLATWVLLVSGTTWRASLCQWRAVGHTLRVSDAWDTHSVTVSPSLHPPPFKKMSSSFVNALRLSPLLGSAGGAGRRRAMRACQRRCIGARWHVRAGLIEMDASRIWAFGESERARQLLNQPVMRGNRTIDRSISYFLQRQTQEKCRRSPAQESFPVLSFLFFFMAPLFFPLQLSSFLPLHLEFGCIVVYLDSFLPLPIPLGRRRRCSWWSLSNGVWAQPVSDESSAWPDHL